jgi:hypothetical protein
MNMQEITGIINLVKDVGFVGVLIILSIPKLRRLLGFENGAATGETPEWAQQLQLHFNDTTSTLLQKIVDGVDKLDDRGEKQCKKLDDIIDFHKETEKYGVRIRKE